MPTTKMKERNNYKKRALFHVTKVLWHLDIFRRSFRELSGHACMGDSCIFCALKDLFGQLQFSHERTLAPDALRKVLAQSFSDQQRFQLGFMDDAAECFENILQRIHFHIVHNEAEDLCSAKHCIPHQKFAMTLVEQSVCGVCHATSEPLPFTQMVHYVSASALISQAKQVTGTSHPDLLGQLLKKAGGMGDIRDCPSSCGAKIQIRRTLINRPEIVSVGIVWDSDRPSLEHIMSLLDTLRVHLRLSDVFHGSFDTHPGDNVYHQLVGVVTYYGKHYSTFFFHTKLRMWVYFDDANVREVGPHWEHVVEKCRRGRYQPLLLLFANPNGTQIDSSSAPKAVTVVDKPAMTTRSNGQDSIGQSTIRRPCESLEGGIMTGRRSLTPNPEKPNVPSDLAQRRAVTPNPDQSVNQKLGKLPHNDYQNLVQFQEVIFNRPAKACDEKMMVQRQDSMEYKNKAGRTELVRHDSGIWSGDRNSASSSSSTSMENPYHYILGKMHLRNYGSVPKSPIKNGGDQSSGSGNSSGGPADPGYDSFSISSTDSYPLQQNLKHNFQLAQIPEGNQTPPGSRYPQDENSRVADECERLCAEVDQLLDRSEHAGDLLTALSLCNAAVSKARAAMDAPYSNPQTASFATMKHNACVLRARSLHRKIEEPLHNNLKYGETRHSREGSGGSARGSSGSHSRQNSKDKGNTLHFRQNSQELLDLSANNSLSSSDFKCGSAANREKLSPSKNIEIYATLPKNKKNFLTHVSPKTTKNFVEDEEYFMKERPGRSALSNRSKVVSKKEVDKRARSEDRSIKNMKNDVHLLDKNKDKESKDSKKATKQEEKQNKKQHKIRRKLLMGGLIRRKNRSMPDLREGDDSGTPTSSTNESPSKPDPKHTSKDDSMVDSKTAIKSSLNGYLSEGNLEYAGNPNLERSKLMRKSFHHHASKLLQFNKVPPPPPLRTTSQLSKNGVPESECRKLKTTNYSNQRWSEEPASLPYMAANFQDASKPKTDAITYSNAGLLLPQPMNTVVTEALIHHEASFQSLPPMDESPTSLTSGKIDEVNFQLPPYPSPIHSTVHSRQASEDFPPPPTTLPAPLPEPTSFSLLSMLQEKRKKMSLNSGVAEDAEKQVPSSGGENWLRELQAKQAERRKAADPPPVEMKNVNDLKSKFEQLGLDEVDCIVKPVHKEPSPPPPTQFSIKSSLAVSEDDINAGGRRKGGKKKNVTFCEQVVLVATADDDEDSSYVPNPILERVLRTVLHKEAAPTPPETKEHAVHSVVPLKRTESWRLSQEQPSKPPATEAKDVVDAPCVPPKSTSVRQMLQQPATPADGCDQVDGPCPPQSSYRQNYMLASSPCPPSRPEYPEPVPPPSHDNSSAAAYAESYDQYSYTNMNQMTRKFNDTYQDNLRYSPVSSRGLSPMQNSGYHSPVHPPYQPPTSNSYQPMSLQYYPSQNRSSPQIPYQTNGVPKSTPPVTVARQNSNASLYSRQDTRRMPLTTAVSSASPKSLECQRLQYVNGCTQSQKSGPTASYPSHRYGNESPRGSLNGMSSQPQPSYGYGGSSDTSRNSPTPRSSLNGTPSQPVPNYGYSSSGGDPASNPPIQYMVTSAVYPSSSQSPSEIAPYQRPPASYSTSNPPQHLPHKSHTPQFVNSNPSGYQYSHHSTTQGQQQQQHLTNGGPHQQNTVNTHQPHYYPQSTPSTSSSCDSSRPASMISPYQSMPHNSPTFESHPRNSPYNSPSPYQHVAQSSPNYQPASKFSAPPQRSSLPPVYQHPPPPSSSSSSSSSSTIKSPAYQRVPTPNQQTRQHSVYQHPPAPIKQPGEAVKKTNAFVPCNLCRKKQISPPSVYCTDCDFYISRFKQKS